MKKAFLIFLSLSLLTSCCKNNKDDNSNDALSISLNKNFVSVFPGVDSYIAIQEDGVFGVSEEDSEIAFAIPTGFDQTIQITGGNKLGSTTVKIIDLNDYSRTVEVLVHNQHFSGIFIDRITKPARDKNLIYVSIDNTELQAKVEQEILYEVNNRHYTVYEFTEPDQLIVKCGPNYYNGVSFIGTYSWKKSSLSLFYNSISEHLSIHFIDDVTIEIEYDFAEKYRALYPDNIITVACATRILTATLAGFM